MLRYRGKKITDIVQKMDSFPKMPEDYKQYSGVGGIVSVFMYLASFWLLLSEITYYSDYRIYNRFVPDTEFNAKLKINIDITIASPCAIIEADIVDVTGQEEEAFGSLQKEDTWFELSPKQKNHFDEVVRVNSYLKKKYHSLKNVIWKTGYMSYSSEMPKRESEPPYPYDACRLRGQLELNKVAGNFHITAGHTLSVPGGHVHIPQLFDWFTNLSHRIDQFSFGPQTPGIIHPLDGTMKVVNDTTTFKYYIEVVPTHIDTSTVRVNTYQYSAKELQKQPSDNAAVHEISGIFFKYDMHPLKVIIREEEYSLFQLLVRICGCLFGLYILFGTIKNVLHNVFSYFITDHEQLAVSSDETPKRSL